MTIRIRPFVAAAALLAAAALGVTGCTADEADGAQASFIPAPKADPTKTVATVVSVSPASGSLVAGETVTIKGTGLGKTASVKFGDQEGSAVHIVSDSALTVVVPPSHDFVEGKTKVSVVATDGKAATLDNAYDYKVVNPVDAQMKYAFTYWKNYNLAEWGNFPDNDCGNFVNQTLLARGWEQTPDWFSDYATTGDFSASWVRGPEMDAWFASNPHAKLLTLDQRDQVKIGDVVMFDWDPQNDNGVDHTMVVSGVKTVDGKVKISLVGHTVDAQYRDLDEAITVDNPGGTAHFWSIS